MRFGVECIEAPALEKEEGSDDGDNLEGSARETPRILKRSNSMPVELDKTSSAGKVEMQRASSTRDLGAKVESCKEEEGNERIDEVPNASQMQTMFNLANIRADIMKGVHDVLLEGPLRGVRDPMRALKRSVKRKLESRPQKRTSIWMDGNLDPLISRLQETTSDHNKHMLVITATAEYRTILLEHLRPTLEVVTIDAYLKRRTQSRHNRRGSIDAYMASLMKEAQRLTCSNPCGWAKIRGRGGILVSKHKELKLSAMMEEAKDKRGQWGGIRARLRRCSIADAEAATRGRKGEAECADEREEMKTSNPFAVESPPRLVILTQADSVSYQDLDALLSHASVSELIIAGDPHNRVQVATPYMDLVYPEDLNDSSQLGTSLLKKKTIEFVLDEKSSLRNELYLKSLDPKFDLEQRYRRMEVVYGRVSIQGKHLAGEIWLNNPIANTGSWSSLEQELLDGLIESSLANMTYDEQARTTAHLNPNLHPNPNSIWITCQAGQIQSLT